MNLFWKTRLFALCALGLGGLVFSALAQEEKESTSFQEKDPYAALEHFGEVFTVVRDSYVLELDNSKLSELALKGMLMKLDPYSTYLNKEEYERMKKSLEGDFVGIGVYINWSNGQFTVQRVIKGGPAEEMKMQSEDQIIKVDGKSVAGRSMDSVLALIKGEEGEPVTLTIMREDEEMEITIVRAKVTKENVEVKMLDNSIGYVKLAEFMEGSSEQVENQLKELAQDQEINAILIDLRNNPGGLLQEAISMADLFLDYGEIVHIKGRGKDSLVRYYAFPGSLLPGKPILVLVNSGSASASEVLAGAFKDLSRGIIAGEKTFGKGSVQNIIPFEGGAAAKITTALYYTPSGDSIQARGITPDILIPREAPKERKTLSEATVPLHLENPNSEKADALKKAVENSSVQNSEEEDYQLARAISILQALALTDKYSW